MKVRRIVLTVSGVALVALFQNCSKQGLQINDLGSNAVTENNTDQNETPPISDNPPPTTVADLISNCDDAKARGKIQSSTTQITFDDNVGQCAWGVGDNLSQQNGLVRTRAEQLRKVTIPAGAVVCQVHLADIDQQNFRYDDNILLTLNNYLLASTTNFQNHFQSKNGYYQYDWLRLRDKNGNVNASDTTLAKQYCAGQDQGLSSCLFPLTETVGSVQLQFNERVIQNILGMTSATDINLTMITTGDNDPHSDCHHNAIRFNVKVDYY